MTDDDAVYTGLTDPELDGLFKACFPELPVTDRLKANLEKLIDRIAKGTFGKDELYQEDAGTSSSGQQAEKR